MKKHISFTAIMTVLLIGLTACGAESDTANESKVQDIQGNPVSLPNEKPTLIYFMATWCPSCIYNEEIFKEMHQLNPNDVQLITVSLDPNTDTKESLAKFKQDYGGDWPHVLKNGKEIADTYGVKQLEEIVLVNSENEVFYRSVRPSFDDLKEALTQIGVEL
ncbi:AhpC/TSA family protein [Staphylococcus aureus]|nr:AhpC/TSA family protein [Staphylococcus aureus]